MPWIDDVNRTLEAARGIEPTRRGVRSILYGVWLVMRSAEFSVRDLYRSFAETDLNDGSAQRTLEDCLREISMPTRTLSQKKKVYFELAVRLRALEDYFFSLDDGSPTTSGRHFLVEFDGNKAYFLHRAPRNRSPKDKESFFRRGLARSRMIPTTLSGIRVEMKVPRDPRGRMRLSRSEPLRFGAGLFPDLAFGFGDEEDGFIVNRVTCAEQIATIGSQLDDASKKRCFAVIYPELTVSEDILQQMSDNMGDGTWRVDNLSMVVAGSRHVRGQDGLFRNAAAILDGYGEEIVVHNKLLRYLDGPYAMEAIEPGTELNIVVLEDAVVVCAICLDFCHLTEDTPHGSVDVDYVVVPSCGDDRTISSHLEKAKVVKLHWKAHTVVVQQFHDGKEHAPGAAPLGYVLGHSSLDEIDVGLLRTMEPWSILSL
ncbi:hypothetical protein [Sinorhizobium terangae]|uniref:hypothetical protein n=1 Tax=Sinorhizobium terangae TaxID=110322 RepID=UPI0024B16E17|nr:hypothetical protein [Sinorhizobium terangae]WFU49109.1 hypothetical protein QA637_06825 [Sinorhizobium terangae]